MPIKINLSPFTNSIDDPNRLKQYAIAREPLKTKYSGQSEHLRNHILEFTHQMESTGLIKEFNVRHTNYPLRLSVI